MKSIAEISEEDKRQVERDLRYRIFSDQEMARRTTRMQEELRANNLDAMLLTDEVNVLYFAGMAVPSFATRTRPIIVVVPVDNPPILICSRSQSSNARSASWIQSIAIFEKFEEDAIDTAAEVLSQFVPDNGQIGCEIGKEQRLGLSFHGFQRLTKRLKTREFVDGSAALWSVRIIKGSEEIVFMKESGRINELAMAAAISAAGSGVSEMSVRNAWAIELARHGVDRPGYLAIHSGANNYRRISSSGTERILQSGDLLWMDGGPIFRGYWSDITRMVSIGKARPADKQRYAFACDTVQALVDSAKPGITAGDIARHGQKLFASKGRLMGGASRIGHGIGIELTEPPSIIDGDETVLVEGMTLSIETGLADWDGYFLMETNLVITNSGSDVLSSPASTTLPETI